jgi:NTE family protein
MLHALAKHGVCADPVDRSHRHAHHYLFPTTAFEEFLRRVLPIQRLEDAAVPVEVVAAEAGSGRTVTLSRGPAVPALLASAAIRGSTPPSRSTG